MQDGLGGDGVDDVGLRRTELQSLRDEMERVKQRIAETTNRIDERNEEIDRKTEHLLSNLEMIKAMDEKITRLKIQIKEAKLKTPAESKLEQMLAMSRRPWEHGLSVRGYRDPQGLYEWKRGVVSELSVMVSSLASLEQRMADPLEGGGDGAELLFRGGDGSRRYGDSKGKNQAPKEATVYFNRRDGLSDVECKVRVSEGQTFLNVLEYACTYWSLDPSRFTIVDGNGFPWPLAEPVQTVFGTLIDSDSPSLHLRPVEGGSNEVDNTKSRQDIGEGVATTKTWEEDDFALEEDDFVSQEMGLPKRKKALSNKDQQVGEDKAKGEIVPVDGEIPEFAEHDLESEAFGTKGKSNVFDNGGNEGDGFDPMFSDVFDRTIEIKETEKRQRRLSSDLVRHHFEMFLYLVLVSLILNLALFSRRVETSGFVYSAIHSAFVTQPSITGSLFSDDQGLDGQGLSNFARRFSLETVTSRERFWSWLDGPVRTLLTSPGSLEVQVYNQLVGNVNLQQLRVQKNVDCARPPGFDLGKITGTGVPETQVCIPPYRSDRKSIENYVNYESVPQSLRAAFRFEPPNSAWPDLVSDRVIGIGTTFNINSGGFMFNLSRSRSEFDAQIEGLRSNKWVDDQTRLIMVNFNLYNPNSDLFMACSGFFQFLATGAIHSRWLATPFRLDNDRTEFDQTRQNLEITALVLFCVIYALIVKDVIFHKKGPLHYMYNTSAFLEVLIVIVTFLLIASTVQFNRKAEVALEHIGNQSFEDPDQGYYDLRGLAYQESLRGTFYGILVILFSLRVLKFFRFSPALSLLWRVLQDAWSMYLTYFFVLGIVFTSFVLFGHFVFGRGEESFHTADLAFASVLQMQVGAFQYERLYRVDSILAPLYFLLAFVICYLIMYRLFIAITVFSYVRIQDQVREKGYFWLPSVNQVYYSTPTEREERKRTHRAQLLQNLKFTKRYGIVPDPSS